MKVKISGGKIIVVDDSGQQVAGPFNSIGEANAYVAGSAPPAGQTSPPASGPSIGGTGASTNVGGQNFVPEAGGLGGGEPLWDLERQYAGHSPEQLVAAWRNGQLAPEAVSGLLQLRGIDPTQYGLAREPIPPRPGGASGLVAGPGGIPMPASLAQLLPLAQAVQSNAAAGRGSDGEGGGSNRSSSAGGGSGRSSGPPAKPAVRSMKQANTEMGEEFGDRFSVTSPDYGYANLYPEEIPLPEGATPPPFDPAQWMADTRGTELEFNAGTGQYAKSSNQIAVDQAAQNLAYQQAASAQNAARADDVARGTSQYGQINDDEEARRRAASIMGIPSLDSGGTVAIRRPATIMDDKTGQPVAKVAQAGPETATFSGVQTMQGPPLMAAGGVPRRSAVPVVDRPPPAVRMNDEGRGPRQEMAPFRVGGMTYFAPYGRNGQLPALPQGASTGARSNGDSSVKQLMDPAIIRRMFGNKQVRMPAIA